MEIKKYSCDICKKEFPDRDSVKGSFVISNTNGDGVDYTDVCKQCVDAVKLFIEDDLIPKA